MSIAKDIKDIVLDALEMDCVDETQCPYTDREFLMHLNGVCDGLSVDILNKNLTGYTNVKKKIYDIREPYQPGTRGYQGRYKLEDDLIKLLRVEVSYDGHCWAKADVSTKDFDYKYECDNCPCEDGCECSITFKFVNGYLEFDPIPVTFVRKGLVVWYEALPEKIETIEQEVPFTRTDHQYIAMQIIDYYMAVHADKYSQAKVNRIFNKFNKTKGRFDKLHNLQTRHRVQKRHQRPYL